MLIYKTVNIRTFSFMKIVATEALNYFRNEVVDRFEAMLFIIDDHHDAHHDAHHLLDILPLLDILLLLDIPLLLDIHLLLDILLLLDLLLLLDIQVLCYIIYDL